MATSASILVPAFYRTDGERLADYLRLRVIPGIDELDGIRRASRTIRRENHLAVACEHLIVFNLLERLMGLARWAARQSDEPAVQENDIRGRLLDEVSIRYEDVPRLWAHLDPAIYQTTRSVSSSLKKELLSNFGRECYVCGRDDGADVTVDHLWPKSMGGNSEFENLLPCCGDCNSTRGNSMSWAHAWFQGLSASPRPNSHEQSQFNFTKFRVAGMYLRALTHSAANGESLQASMIAVGPNVDRDLSDVEQPIDFFLYASMLDANP
jgi:5-methylcytosine-specific restriction endonuclease McrA